MSFEVPIIILILVIPTYFLCKWVLTKRNIGNEKSRKFSAIIPTLILSPIIYIGIIYLWMFSVSYYPSNDFNKQKWETNIEERYKMSEDIIESKMLIGKSKEDIIELLGEGSNSRNRDVITYYIGFVPGLFNIDPDALHIYFDNGKAIKVEQLQN